MTEILNHCPENLLCKKSKKNHSGRRRKKEKVGTRIRENIGDLKIQIIFMHTD